MADWYGKKRMDHEDLQEEDVWGVVMERDQKYSSPQVKKAQKAHKRYSSSTSSSSSSGYGSSSAWNNLPAAPRNNISRTHEGMMVPHQQQSSAAMSVPDWSKIYSRKKSNQLVEVDDDDHGGNYNYSGDYQECVHVGGEEEEEEMVPPHEYIARRLARTQISSYSMCEGVGGTLKGRDLSKLRNAILTKTGFLE